MQELLPHGVRDAADAVEAEPRVRLDVRAVLARARGGGREARHAAPHASRPQAEDERAPRARARAAGLTSTVTFPRGNLCPDGAVIKSTAIDPSVVGPDGVYRKKGPAKVFTAERDAVAAVASLSRVAPRTGSVFDR